MKSALIILSCVSCLLFTACSSSEAHVAAKEHTVSNKVIAIAEDDIPTYEEVLFIEVPDSRGAAESFLKMIHGYDIKVKHVSITDYGEDNYTLDCTFDNEAYTIRVYVRQEEECTKWYGNLMRDGEFVRTWEFEVDV